MKYYCGDCKVTYDISIEPDYDPADMYGNLECKFCHTGLSPLPEWETVAQWEARTGRMYPDTAPVFVWFKNLNTWTICTYEQYVMSKVESVAVIVATEAGAPSDDWIYKNMNCRRYVCSLYFLHKGEKCDVCNDTTCEQWQER
jgi:hypothetical protein